MYNVITLPSWKARNCVIQTTNRALRCKGGNKNSLYIYIYIYIANKISVKYCNIPVKLDVLNITSDGCLKWV